MRETRQPGMQRYIPGDSYHDCDVCGFTYLMSELTEQWDGALVCDEDFELPPWPNLPTANVNSPADPTS